MKRFVTVLAIALITLMCMTSSRKQTTIFMIGDSTMADKDISKGSPERGWGMVLQGFFTEDIVVDNHARNGRSSISFRNEGMWKTVLERIKPGDYVFIQFGHNDEKLDKPNSIRHTDPGSTFDEILEKYVRETREKGGIPVLFNCVERRNFFDARKAELQKNTASAAEKNAGADDETLRDTKYGDEVVNTEYLVPTHYTVHGDYTVAPRLVAKRLEVPFIDATHISKIMEQDHGVVGSRKLHVWLKPGEVASIPDGRRDNTHYSVYGARTIAALLIDAVGEKVPELKKYIRHYEYVVSEQGRGNYLTLQEAVDAVPQNAKAKILILDGKFKKPQTDKKIKYEVRDAAELIK
ncbi:MAG: rhamnogalacturonan acetylesterase [Prevotella sp.]|nr:rhamnogalacturonan acetylesterase [Prevotella sp.]